MSSKLVGPTPAGEDRMSSIVRVVPLLAWVLSVAVPASPLRAQGGTAGAAPRSDSLYKYVLDYDVPESPAFTALGVTPAAVLRGGIAKPVAVSALTNALSTGKLKGGLALDLSPMVFASPVFRDFDQYQHSLSGILLRRLLVSLGTVQADADTASLRLGAGVRFTLYDANDPLTSRELFEQVDRVLRSVASAQGAPAPGTATGVGAPVTISLKDSLAALYKRARDEARNRKGWAVSVGWGIAALVRSSVLDADSLQDGASSAWLAGRYKFATPASFLFTGEWRQVPGRKDDLRGGIAVRAELESVSAAAELVYDALTGTLQPGGNAELRVLPGTRVVLGIVSEPPGAATGGHSKLRVKTSLKWDFAELLRK